MDANSLIRVNDPPHVDAGLVFDVGMNDGEDTAYYLKRGFRVVGVEANPELCRQAQVRFDANWRTGQLRIEHAAISDRPGINEFFVNTANHHWSSLDRSWAMRANSEVHAISVPGVSLAELFLRHGTPHYLKIDIEGADLLCLQQLMDAPRLPHYLSIEDCRLGFEYVEHMRSLGYRRFKLSDQHAVAGSVDITTGHVFRLGSSGPFGDDLLGDWLDADVFSRLYESKIRDRATATRKSPPHVWWDIHASLA